MNYYKGRILILKKSKERLRSLLCSKVSFQCYQIYSWETMHVRLLLLSFSGHIRRYILLMQTILLILPGILFFSRTFYTIPVIGINYSAFMVYQYMLLLFYYTIIITCLFCVPISAEYVTYMLFSWSTFLFNKLYFEDMPKHTKPNYAIILHD